MTFATEKERGEIYVRSVRECMCERKGGRGESFFLVKRSQQSVKKKKDRKREMFFSTRICGRRRRYK